MMLPPSPKHPYMEILTPSVLVLGDGAFGRWLDPEGREVENVIGAFIEKTLRSSLTHSAR